jgi:CxxC motif-containing protein
MKQIVCILCPNSCLLNADLAHGKTVISGNQCGRGIEFGEKELTDPERVLTTTLRLKNGLFPLISVKSDRPVKKDVVARLIRELNEVIVEAPVKAGQKIKSAVGINQVDIIATRSAVKGL